MSRRIRATNIGSLDFHPVLGTPQVFCSIKDEKSPLHLLSRRQLRGLSWTSCIPCTGPCKTQTPFRRHPLVVYTSDCLPGAAADASRLDAFIQFGAGIWLKVLGKTSDTSTSESHAHYKYEQGKFPHFGVPPSCVRASMSTQTSAYKTISLRLLAIRARGISPG